VREWRTDGHEQRLGEVGAGLQHTHELHGAQQHLDWEGVRE
jgi:hypothetical protein